MDKLNALVRIVSIKEEVRLVNHLSRKIYLLALNAMLMSRKAGGVGTGYARVTLELRAFSESLEQSMHLLTEENARIAGEVSLVIKLVRLERLYSNAQQQAEKRHGAKYINGQNFTQNNANNSGNYDAFMGVTRRLGRLRNLCRQGQNVAVLAKVEAMYIDTHSHLLHNISDEVSTLVEQVEESIQKAFDSATNEGVIA